MNEQPLGFLVPDWTPRSLPPVEPIDGRWCRLEPLDPERHADHLYDANAADATGALWTYLRIGPFSNREQYRAWVREVASESDPLFFAILDRATDQATGVASLLRINPTDGVIEVGWIIFSPLLQRTRAATEAMYLLMRLVFDALGYRRYEWKCNSLNAASRRAAERLGFTYEGTFRQAKVDKGRNRDNAWLSIIDTEWPAIRDELERWLGPENFDAAGRQLSKLETQSTV